MINLLSSLAELAETFITGGNYGSSVRSDDAFNRARWHEQRRKDFAEFGRHDCKICDTKIPGNISHCGSCFRKYIKK